MQNLTTIIMAAGKGTRMQSSRPKVLQTLGGKPLLRHVLDTAKQLGSERIIVVYGFGGEQVKAAFADYGVHNGALEWVEQAEQLGTGHAVQMTLPHLPTTGKSLILSGDVPLIGQDTLQQLIDSGSQLAMVTLALDNPFGLGRIVRDAAGKVTGIVEEKDATPEQKQIQEINSGIYLVDNAILQQFLPKLSNDNAQGEYYLTDIVQMAIADGVEVATVAPKFGFEVEGVNDRVQLARLERRYQSHQVEQLQRQGVQFADPSRVDIRGQLSVGRDVFVDVNVVFEGDVQLGDHVYIEAGCVISDSSVGNACHLKPYCVIHQATIGAGVDIGPFAHLRPDTQLADGVKIGNFVETKKAQIGAGSKVNHLSYIGDATIGSQVNIGAGTITCNYDGVNKSKTQIGDDAFIGSNASLVAPVQIGAGATIGAGSVITQAAPADKLTLARAKQVTVERWQRPSKK